MNQREAMREAHRWVAAVIDGALGNGLLDELAEDEIDEERVRTAIQEISRRHRRHAVAVRPE